MSRHTTVIASLAAVALLGLAGCASSDGTDTETEPSGENKPSGALANLDTCKILTPQQLEAGGFTFTERKDIFNWEPGCSYSGDTVGLALYKNQNETVESFPKVRNVEDYKPAMVNGRSGAQTKSAVSGEDQCWTLIPAGGGVVITSVQADDPRNPIDGCAESMKIAQQIEPNLPE